ALGKQTNQNFVSVPFFKFINMLRYKCKMAGINLAEQEESYTSAIHWHLNQLKSTRNIKAKVFSGAYLSHPQAKF
ncbi:MAG: IS200/IS605 family accessory protein TnpB-related protein, partial [Succinimonas sp.]|nr:IS200/IS605 family accessory protein TnpB-related protein [Succinimonas sp.]